MHHELHLELCLELLVQTVRLLVQSFALALRVHVRLGAQTLRQRVGNLLRRERLGIREVRANQSLALDGRVLLTTKRHPHGSSLPTLGRRGDVLQR